MYLPCCPTLKWDNFADFNMYLELQVQSCNCSDFFAVFFFFFKSFSIQSEQNGHLQWKKKLKFFSTGIIGLFIQSGSIKNPINKTLKKNSKKKKNYVTFCLLIFTKVRRHHCTCQGMSRFETLQVVVHQFLHYLLKSLYYRISSIRSIQNGVIYKVSHICCLLAIKYSKYILCLRWRKLLKRPLIQSLR